jgi:transcription elongation factor GreA
MEKEYLTPQGYSKLLKMIDVLIKEKVPESIASIAKAQENGGELSENTEYLLAMDERDRLESRLTYLTDILDKAQVSDIKHIREDGKVRFGSTVHMLDLDIDKEFTYKIVGVIEADIKEGSVSYKSPIGRSLIGSNVEDEIDLEIPSGFRVLEILGVKHI